MHVRGIAAHLALLASDQHTPDACVAATARMLCFTCDAQFGVMPARDTVALCARACDEWWHACRTAFYHSATTGDAPLHPCRSVGAQQPLVCAQLHEIVQVHMLVDVAPYT